MNPSEIALMAAVEGEHWWYRGLRDLLARLLSGPCELAPGAKILDAGCGTGANLRHLQEILRPAYLGGFDLSPEAIAWSRRKSPLADLYVSDLRDPELHADGFDLVLSLDAIYIPGLTDSVNGLRRLASALRPGGLFLLHLPALPWLRGEHDVAVQTRDRFTRARIQTLFALLGLEPMLLTYRLFWLLPLIVATRIPSRLLRPRARAAARSDLHRRQPAAVENFFYATLRAENRRIAAGGTFPWGSSILGIGRRSG